MWRYDVLIHRTFGRDPFHYRPLKTHHPKSLTLYKPRRTCLLQSLHHTSTPPLTIMKSVMIITLLAAAAVAAPEFKTTTEDKDAAPTPPICTFDPVKGEYVCPEGANMLVRAVPSFQVDPSAEFTTSTAELKTASTDASAGASADAPAADCGKCQADWDLCMTHWGCWFYDCRGACHCTVLNHDPSCAECGHECHA